MVNRKDFRPYDNTVSKGISDKDRSVITRRGSVKESKSISEIRKENILSKSSLNKNNIESKGFVIDTHSQKKTELEYKQLSKPKIKYYVNNKDGTIMEINKTEYTNLDIKNDNEKNKTQLKYSGYISDTLYERYKDKDYEHLNYLSNDEKRKIRITKLYYSGEYEKALNEIENKT